MARAATRKAEPSVRVYPATPSRWKHVEALFGERGACAGCWCMYWRRGAKEWNAGKGPGNKRAFRKLITNGAKPGVIAYVDREPVGWCAVAPRQQYPRLANSRILAPLDDEPVWSITCLFVDRAYRRRGLSALLVAGAVDYARRRGARVVEGYPMEPGGGKAADAFIWMGVPSAYRKAGFREVARRSKTRPIMRIVLD